MNCLKGTGRTTRMLQEAIQCSKEGRAVYVVAATQQHMRQLQKMCGADGLFIKFETLGSLSDFDFINMRSIGAHPNCLFFIDHYAIECKFAKMLEVLHKYD